MSILCVEALVIKHHLLRLRLDTYSDRSVCGSATTTCSMMEAGMRARCFKRKRQRKRQGRRGWLKSYHCFQESFAYMCVGVKGGYVKAAANSAGSEPGQISLEARH